MAGEELLAATERIQRDIAVGSADSALDHLGEAASIALLQSARTGRLISTTTLPGPTLAGAESGPARRSA